MRWSIPILAATVLVCCTPEVVPESRAPKPGQESKETATHQDPAAKAEPRAEGWRHLERGTMPDDALALELPELLGRLEELEGKLVRVRGTFEVGCPGGGWALIGRHLPGGPIRVRCPKRAIRFPHDAMGANLDVVGVLQRRNLPVDLARHYEEERAERLGEEPGAIDAPVQEWEIQAVAWVLDR